MPVHRLDARGFTLVFDADPWPTLVHVGADPGPLGLMEAALWERPLPPAGLDVERPISLLPVHPGIEGRPALEVHRPDGPLVPRFDEPAVEVDEHSLRAVANDGTRGLRIEARAAVAEVATFRLIVTNTGTAPLFVDRLAVTVPLPDEADEVLRFEGAWTREFQTRRLSWPTGVHVIDNRRGRTSHDAWPVVFAGPTGFGEHRGAVVGAHLAWSADHELRLERLADGRRLLQAAELLRPGEVVLDPGESYETPELLLAAGEGLTACSQAFHRHVRGTQPATPRPVLLNTWEAVYFDHDRDRLFALADRAARVGVERFVLDDGWFGGRRNDRAGLGDWVVSPDVYPDGLDPLIDHVTGLGMEFGLWFEPEMVNPDSDLYRTHPDWVLGDPGVLGRGQLVLDLSIDACWHHLHDRIDTLLADHDIAFVKWDMNRDVAGAGTHRQTHALYRLLDSLRSRHPDVEIESCASGGGRADTEILRRTQRIWTSDCNDPLDRQRIQRGFSHLLPPEVMGAHIGPPRAHTTGRVSRLAFRAATALFGHLGIEWNLLDCDERDLDRLTAWVARHKELRPLLHGGDVVRIDPPEPEIVAHGVVAADRARAVFSVALLDRPAPTVPPRLRLPGLDPDATYRVTRIEPGDRLGLTLRQPSWVADGLQSSGRALATVGVQLPAMLAESTLLFECAAR